MQQVESSYTEARQDMVNWMVHREHLFNVILNGGVRGLYPEELAERIVAFLEENFEDHMVEALTTAATHFYAAAQEARNG